MSIKPKPTIVLIKKADTPAPPVPPESVPEETPAVDAQVEPTAEEAKSFFQAVGIIAGEVEFDDNDQCQVIIGQKQYPLFYASNHKRAYEALKKEIEATGKKYQRLIVYPRLTHFPKREQSHHMSFQLAGFDNGREPSGVASELKDFEFKLSGLWQFIPVCQIPCISVFKNFTDDRLSHIKKIEPGKKVRFMKASHIPIIWKEAPVRPFKFNPKLDKQQQSRPYFVQVRANFLPEKDIFVFTKLSAEPTEAVPRFLKASKKDKTEAQKLAPKRKPLPKTLPQSEQPQPQPRKPISRPVKPVNR